MDTEERHLELTNKFIEMGTALINEGESKKDYKISSLGNFMVFISGLMYDDDDIKFFSELCAMFSAKKVLDFNESIEGDASITESDDILPSIDELYKLLNSKELDDTLFDDDNDDDSDDETP